MGVTIDLSGRVALVTGAGTGIGNGTAAVLAAAGARVVVADIDADAAADAVGGIIDAGGAAEALTVDVRDADAVRAMAEQITAAHGRLDVLVNNVGHYIGARSFEKSDFAHWDALHAVNFAHVLSCTREFLPGMLERGSGSIINVSSVEGIRGYPPDPVYGAYKAAVIHFTRCLALDVAGRGVRVNAIAPDVTQTPQVDYRNRIPEDLWERWPLWVPIGRVGEPADNADVVLFLASDLSRWVTGHVIPTDGGTLAAGGWFRTAPDGRWDESAPRGMSADRTPEDAPLGALAGLRVLDLANLLPAPLIAAMLGDFGADVVKVEPPSGDGLRSLGFARDGRSLPWALAGRNKRTVELDPETDDGRALLQRLTDVSDVVIVNQPRKVLERWGCTYEAIAARNPRAVVVSLSLYGTEGPYAARGGNGTLAEAFGGLTHMTGEPDGPPLLPSIPLGDVLGAITGLVGTLVACLARERGNAEGQYVDIAMYEPVVTLLSTALVAWQPGQPPPMRTGSRVPGGVPRNTYRTGDDRWVVLSGPTDPQVARVLEVIGLDTPDAHARYGTSRARLEHADELDGLVAVWIAEHDHHAVVRAFDDARVPVTLVNDLATLTEDPHVQARESVLTVDDPVLGPVLLPAPMARLSATPGSVRWLGREQGADTDAVIEDWLRPAD